MTTPIRVDFSSVLRHPTCLALIRALPTGGAPAREAFTTYIAPFVEAEVAHWPLWSDAWRVKT